MPTTDSNFQVTQTRSRDTFYFHGEASGAAVRINSVGGRQVNLVSPVDGQSALPIIGGMSRSSVDGSLSRFAEFIHYGKCETSAEGKLVGTGDAQQAETTVSASVADFRVLNRPAPGERDGVTSVEFEASRIAIAVKSIHQRSGQNDFLLQEAAADGMCILIRRGTAIESIPIQLKFFPFEIHSSGLPNIKGLPSTPVNNGIDHGSIVSAIIRNGQEYPGHVLTEAGLGTIVFGETLIEAHSRRITMIRIKMGSDVDGETSAAAVGPNGVWPKSGQ